MKGMAMIMIVIGAIIVGAEFMTTKLRSDSRNNSGFDSAEVETVDSAISWCIGGAILFVGTTILAVPARIQIKFVSEKLRGRS